MRSLEVVTHDSHGAPTHASMDEWLKATKGMQSRDARAWEAYQVQESQMENQEVEWISMDIGIEDLRRFEPHSFARNANMLYEYLTYKPYESSCKRVMPWQRKRLPGWLEILTRGQLSNWADHINVGRAVDSELNKQAKLTENECKSKWNERYLKAGIEAVRASGADVEEYKRNPISKNPYVARVLQSRLLNEVATHAGEADPQNPYPKWDPVLAPDLEPFHHAKHVVVSDSSLRPSTNNGTYKDKERNQDVMKKLLIRRGFYETNKQVFWDKHAQLMKDFNYFLESGRDNKGFVKMLKEIVDDKKYTRRAFDEAEWRQTIWESLSERFEEKNPVVLHLVYGANSLYDGKHQYKEMTDENWKEWQEIVSLLKHFDYVVVLPVFWAGANENAMHDMSLMMRYAQQEGYPVNWVMCEEFRKHDIHSKATHFKGSNEEHTESLAKAIDVQLLRWRHYILFTASEHQEGRYTTKWLSLEEHRSCKTTS